MERLFILKTLSHTQRATKVKKFVGICLKRQRSRVIPRNMSEKANMLIIPTYPRSAFSADTQRSARGYPTIVNNVQPCPKGCLLMPLALVGARTESTTRYSFNTRSGQFPRTRIDIIQRSSMRRGFCTSVLFIDHSVIIPTVSTQNGDSAVIIATVKQEPATLRELVRAGSDLNLQNQVRYTVTVDTAPRTVVHIRRASQL